MKQRFLNGVRCFGLAAVVFAAGQSVGCTVGHPPLGAGPAPGVPPQRGGQPPPPQYVYDQPKPLPDPRRAELPAPPFDDFPLISQRIPEQTEFLRGYEAVGRPRIAVFVNRTLQGELVPVTTEPPPSTAYRERYDAQFYDQYETFDDREKNLQPGQYDAGLDRSIDYQTVETVLTQWLSADGQVTVVSPTLVRARLKADEIAKLEQGRLRELRSLVTELDADILVHVQARPTQTQDQVSVRLVAEAVNVVGGESIGRATVLIPPPFSSEQINKFTRFVARKLMSDMTLSWSSPGPERRNVPPNGGAVEPAPPQPGPVQPGPVQPGIVQPGPVQSDPFAPGPSETPGGVTPDAPRPIPPERNTGPLRELAEPPTRPEPIQS